MSSIALTRAPKSANPLATINAFFITLFDAASELAFFVVLAFVLGPILLLDALAAHALPLAVFLLLLYAGLLLLTAIRLHRATPRDVATSRA